MANFTRIPTRFACSGLVLNAPKDIIKTGGFAKLTNMRSYTEGTVEVRPGTGLVSTLPGPVHSIFRLNDPTPSNGGVSAIRVFGVGGSLYAEAINGTGRTVLDSGYSGNPLTAVPIQPVDATQPYLYVVDSDRMQKFRTDRTGYGVGIEAPKTEPTALVQQLGVNIISQFDLVPAPLWVFVGTNQTIVLNTVVRTLTKIVEILYDSGSAPGYASIVTGGGSSPVFDLVGEGELVEINNVETVAVTAATIAVARTTIAAILYDAGSTGLCTIQPAGSLGTGQVRQPSLRDILQSVEPTVTGTAVGGSAVVGSQDPLPGTNISQPNFPVDCLVRLNTELVRIISVAVGRDGVKSFRCSTTAHHGVGEPIVGVAAFRAWVNGTYGAGANLVDVALQTVITPLAPNPQTDPPTFVATAGLRTAVGFPPINLAYINGRATLDDDDLRLNVKLSDCQSVQTVRVYLSLNPTAGSSISDADFTENYYFFEWRQSDIALAIQATNTAAVQTLEDARETVLRNQQLNARPNEVTSGKVLGIFPFSIEKGGTVGLQSTNQIDTSDPLSLGNNQWLQLKCKIRDLIHIGTDPTKTLADVTAVEVLFAVSRGDSNFPTTVTVDAIWISGGYQPDARQATLPYTYAYRYRSSITGVKSNPSPVNRGAVVPQRQGVLLTGVHSADPQVDLVDWFRFGGTVVGSLPMYMGTGPNGSPPTFLDVYSDSEVLGFGELADYERYQLWPTTGLDATGGVNVSGTAVSWVAGDQFDTSWAPGAQIRIGGQPYTLFRRPPSATFLEVTENVGNMVNVEYTVSSPAVLKQDQPTLWGPFQGFYFSVGDPSGPQLLKWTNGNDADTTSLAYSLSVTNPSEPLLNGFIWDGVNFVWSSEQLYRVEPDFSKPNLFRAYLTPCGRGLWSRWAFCITPQGVVFLAKDGLYITNGGSPAISISNADLYRLFPHDGVPGDSVNGYLPPDMSQFAGLRLSYVDGYVYFDFSVAA